jgi:hypothetical protein
MTPSKWNKPEGRQQEPDWNSQKMKSKSTQQRNVKPVSPQLPQWSVCGGLVYPYTVMKSPQTSKKKDGRPHQPRNETQKI